MAIIIDGNGNDMTPPGSGGPAPQAAGGDVVKDTDTAGFMADVIEASQQVPVIVDFWAPWCGPCKQLGPALERLVRQYGGRVRMVKVNVDENQELAGQFRIQSIPAVYAFKGGRPVDGFMGALPESQLKQFIERLLGGAGGGNVIDDALAQAKEMQDAGDHETALQVYQQILQQDQGNPDAIAGALRSYVATGQSDLAEEVLKQLPPDILKHPGVQAVKTQLELMAQGGAGGDIAEAEAKVQANPDDHQARYDLSMAYYAAGRKQEAANALLEIIRRDRTWNEEAARQQLLKLFEAFGPADPVTMAARRKLSSLLFS